jgi:hypothetical protein
MRTPSACTWLLLCVLAACGGGGGGGGSASGGGIGVPPAGNVLTVTVDAGPAGSVNSLFATVRVCGPGTSNCATVDHVLVDTGSTGLRLVASVLPAGFALPAVNVGSGAALYECQPFADGYTWGSLRSADMQLGGESASSVPIQVIGESGAPAVPADCPNGSPQENSVQTLGANGILGIGVFREDCGAACAAAAVSRAYYSCLSGVCASAAVPLIQQLQNPVYRFAIDNNGVQVQLPVVGAAGAIGAMGSVIFGIDTESNNQLGAATALRVDASFGTLTTVYRGQSMGSSFIDTGANALFFADSSMPLCTSSLASGFYCPTTVQSLSANMQGLGGSPVVVGFSVANTDALLGNNPTFTAYQNLAGTNPANSSFVWGLPFFYGRHVYFVIEGQSSSGGTGPLVAF